MRDGKSVSVISWIAGIVAAIVAISLPAGYFSVAYSGLASELAIEAKFLSVPITRFINEHPDTWTISEHDLVGLLTRKQLREKQLNRLLTPDNREVKQVGQEPGWPALVLTTDVYDSGEVAGRLELQLSIREIVRNTLFVGLFGLLLAAAIFVTLRVLPLHALQRATAALEDEVKQHARARATAEAANRAKSQFLAAASHDLRQPLHALGLFAATLSEKVNDPAVRPIVDNITASVEALEGLFNELLDISKLDAGVVQPNLVSFSVHPLFERLRVDYGPAAREKGLRLVVMPSAAGIYSDPVLCERLLRNLISNAIRYTSAGGVVVGCRRRGGRYSLEVWDSGIGIAADKAERIFEEFYQVGNPERDRRKGLGLGLAIVKRIEQLLGYEITLSSRVGHGSVFRFGVPRGVTEAPERMASTQTDGGAHSLQGKCVVVVDDELTVREGMNVLLSGWGCDVIAADSLAEAMQLIGEHARKPDAILSDYRLREGATGIEAIRALHAEFGGDIPALLITGDISAENLREARASGYAQLHKPVAPAKLRESLISMLTAR